jgi:hypothetical protein
MGLSKPLPKGQVTLKAFLASSRRGSQNQPPPNAQGLDNTSNEEEEDDDDEFRMFDDDELNKAFEAAQTPDVSTTPASMATEAVPMEVDNPSNNKLPWQETDMFNWCKKYMTGIDEARGSTTITITITNHTLENTCKQRHAGMPEACTCKPINALYFEMFDSPMCQPPDVIILRARKKTVPTSFWHRKPVYFWVPEFFFNDDVPHIFCPRCDHIANRSGWTRHVCPVLSLLFP